MRALDQHVAQILRTLKHAAAMYCAERNKKLGHPQAWRADPGWLICDQIYRWSLDELTSREVPVTGDDYFLTPPENLDNIIASLQQHEP